MNTDDLLDLMNGTKDKYVVEALENREPRGKTSRPVLRLNRIGLIAAIVAMALLLAGCTVAVFLRLQDMSIGQETYTQKFDDQGHTIPPTEKTREVFTFFGHGGSPAQLAAREWYEFAKTYEPGDVGNVANLPNVPDLYEYNYDCLDEEMVAKIDEIAAKYHLKLLDTRIGFQSYQSDMVLEALGLTSLYRSDAGVKESPVVGMVYPPSNLRFYVSFTLTGEDALWTTPVSGNFYYSQKDYFPLPYYLTFDNESVQQWDYTAADGTKLLLALDDKGYGYIVADLPDAILGIQLTISLNHQMYESIEAPTRAVLEQLADAFDYSIQPKLSDPAGLQAALEASDAQWNDQQFPEAPTFDGLDAYFSENVVELRNKDYCGYDFDGDGQEEVLIRNHQTGLVETILDTKDGVVTPNFAFNIRLLENGMVGDYSDQALEDQWGFQIHKPYSSKEPVHLLENNMGYGMGDLVEDIIYVPGEGWTKQTYQGDSISGRTPMTEEEVKAVLDAYPTMELPWVSTMEYTLENGKTLGQILAELDVLLSGEELRAEYAKQAAAFIEGTGYVRYCLRDINGDGVEDLLLSSDSLADILPISATHYWQAFTIRYGKLLRLDVDDFFLCEDGVLEHYGDGPSFVSEGREEVHHFFRLKDREKETLAKIIYLRATDSWVDGDDYTPISTAEAEAILAKYPRIDQGMRPISELRQ